MAYILNRVIRKLQTLMGIGGTFSVETAIASRAVLDKSNNPRFIPDNPAGTQLILTDAYGNYWAISIVAGNLVHNQVYPPFI